MHVKPPVVCNAFKWRGARGSKAAWGCQNKKVQQIIGAPWAVLNCHDHAMVTDHRPSPYPLDQTSCDDSGTSQALTASPLRHNPVKTSKRPKGLLAVKPVATAFKPYTETDDSNRAGLAEPLSEEASNSKSDRD